MDQIQNHNANDWNLSKSSNSGRRAYKNKAAQVAVTVGGIMVFVALLLIFLYLIYVIKPLFIGATITPVNSITYHDDTSAIMLGMDEQNELVYRISQNGYTEFFSVLDGQLLVKAEPLIPEGLTVTSTAISSPAQQIYAIGLNNGSVLLINVEFGVSYPNNTRLISPSLFYPMGKMPLQLSSIQQSINQLVFGYSLDKTTFVYRTEANNWFLHRRLSEENMMTEEVEWQIDTYSLPNIPAHVERLLLTPDQNQLFVQSNSKIFVYDIRNADNINLLQVIDIDKNNTQIADIELLAGASSILVAYQNGDTDQYFQVNTEKGRLYRKIRSFESSAQISSLAVEFYRKSFLTIDKSGVLSLFYTASERQLLTDNIQRNNVNMAAFSPRSTAIVIDDGKQLTIFSVKNPHPEVSWSALWQKIWYEGYPEPQYIWQSTSGSDDFEAKLSLTPLVFGTLKAAFYAMLFAVPLAISGAIYTAYFMSAKVRSIVKPTIEIMEALPTVILGFLAGLWLAPFIENNLPGFFIFLVSLPMGILLTALLWHIIQLNGRHTAFNQYKEFILLPIIGLIAWVCFSLSPVIEIWFFNGNSREFITNELGISFDQRNALVVGIAMGFAVIPTIFSIAEDAIFSVPKHLSNGSLALGATPWQTLTKVVLLTASPGIFSAVMMGLGRAVGETMIVLMATGNTPIMDWSFFQGMRTLAANIAVEMPESAIGSTHYRVLFLAAFVLFVFTFFFNTLAELVRQRLRERYSSL